LLSKLKIGEFTPPIYMDKYYYILRLKEKKEPYIPDFQTIKDKVKEVFIKEAARKIAQQKIEDALKELKTAYKTNSKTLDFDKIAKIYGLKSDSTGLFKYGSYIEGIGASDNFFTAAVYLKEDDTSGIIEMPSGFYIIKLKSKIPVDEKKFTEEKPEFAKKLMLQKKEEYFSRFLQDSRKSLRDNF
jgi:parvulin-like peptidyl-prolyl isomerase